MGKRDLCLLLIISAIQKSLILCHHSLKRILIRRIKHIVTYLQLYAMCMDDSV